MQELSQSQQLLHNKYSFSIHLNKYKLVLQTKCNYHNKSNTADLQ